MPIVAAGYPTIQTWANTVRMYINDTFLSGAGRIFTDDAPFTLPILNAALSDFQRELDSASIPTRFNEAFFTAIPKVNSVLGQGQPNPNVQQELSYTGFFDGLVNYANPKLPSDLLVPKRMWFRQTGTGLTYSEFFPAPAGLESLFQDYAPGTWDWRANAIFWNGSLVPIDVRIRYVQQIGFYGGISAADFPNTPLPFRDCVEVLALMGAEKFASSRLPDGATAGGLQKIRDAMDKVINREVKALQSRGYSRQPYGQNGDIFSW